MQSIIDFLLTYIEIKQCKNNKKVYISKECPICGEIGKRIFRYNTKLKVGKSYCCGFSFKEQNILIKQITEHKKYKQWLKDKMSMNYNSFEKSKKVDDDFNLPF